jgi:hypothetical protein
MRSQNRWRGIGVGVFMGVLLSAAGVPAGSLEPGGGPTAADSQMYTLEQIYDRLNTGAAATKMTAFTEPISGPGTGTMRTIDEIMAKAPALDAINGATAADVTSGKTFWGLTAGTWGLRTGTGSGGGCTYNAGVPRTGQTPTVPLNPAPAGSDGALQKGVAWPNPRFTDNSNGTVTDNLTGLIWLKNANCLDTVGGINKGGGILTWANALTWSNNMAAGSRGLTDGSTVGQWRLPNVREMQSLIHYAFFNPALPNTDGSGKWTEGVPFTGVQSHLYLTSATYADTTGQAWYVNLYIGLVSLDDKSNPYYVWPVRGGQ